MASKTPIIRLCAASLLLAGCATVHDQTPAETPAQKPAVPAAAPSAPPMPHRAATAAKPKPKTRPRPAASAARQTPSAPGRADLPSMIGQGAAWTGPGYHSLSVQRGAPSPQQPVPIFRQASALASVRAALAGSPAQPQAEFRRGLLTLTFDHGSTSDIAAAVNKAMTVPEARHLQVILP